MLGSRSWRALMRRNIIYRKRNWLATVRNRSLSHFLLLPVVNRSLHTHISIVVIADLGDDPSHFLCLHPVAHQELHRGRRPNGQASLGLYSLGQ